MGTEGGRIKAEKEAPFVQRILDPLKPTEKEVEMHSLTHWPFRNGCPHGVRAKGTGRSGTSRGVSRSSPSITVSRGTSWATS